MYCGEGGVVEGVELEEVEEDFELELDVVFG